jgi:hypothetical protein
MAERSVVILGLPGSGKTTFLAALWHLITERELPTRLRFHNLRVGDAAHLNAIAARWRSATVQDRTSVGGNRIVSMNLRNAANDHVRVTFPDVAGEAYRQMWEDRDCDPEVADILQDGGVLLFVHADTIRAPQWVVDVAALSQRLGLNLPAGQELAWHPRLAPTQVQLVGLLELMREPPLDVGPRRLTIMLSAWDKALGERLAPGAFLAAKLPLMHQYLRSAVDGWIWRVYGVSAQGGDYDPIEPDAPRVAQAEELRALDRPSMRINLIGDNAESHDLTEPLAWLMG